jgi:hypothetical protein
MAFCDFFNLPGLPFELAPSIGLMRHALGMWDWYEEDGPSWQEIALREFAAKKIQAWYRRLSVRV